MLLIVVLTNIVVLAATTRQNLTYHWERDATTGHGTLRTQTSHDGAIVRVTFHNPPINLYDNRVVEDFYSFLQAVQPQKPGSDGGDTVTWPKVVMISSDIEHCWVGSWDVDFLGPQNHLDDETPTSVVTEEVQISSIISQLPSIFIAEVDGATTGSGNELLVTCDMTFGGPDASFSTIETGVGGLPGNGGVQYMAR